LHIGGRKKHETGESREEELYNLNSSNITTIKLRRIRWAGHVAGMGEMRNVYKVLVTNPEEKTPLGRYRHRWEDNIIMYFKEI
jgi:hypothetical protein